MIRAVLISNLDVDAKRRESNEHIFTLRKVHRFFLSPLEKKKHMLLVSFFLVSIRFLFGNSTRLAFHSG